MPDPTAAAQLSPKQKRLLDQYQQAQDAYWLVFDQYKQALSNRNKARDACRAAGIDILDHLPSDA
jgi:hypothetical protein